MKAVAVIVLAAGLSTRMGARNKLLLRWDETTVLGRVLSALRPFSDGPVTVVTGHDHAQVVAAHKSESAVFVHNPRFAEGQMSSVDAGLRAAPPAQATVLALGDMPCLDHDHVAALLDAHRRCALGRVTVPMDGDQRGHPIVIPHNIRTRLLPDPAKLGCQGFTRANPHKVHRFETAHSGFVDDIDTEVAYERLRARHTAENV